MLRPALLEMAKRELGSAAPHHVLCDLPLRPAHPGLFQAVADLRGMPPTSNSAGRPRSTSPSRALSSCSPLAAMPFARPRRHPAIRKGHVMSKRENNANNVFRPSDRPLTEYEEEQKALRKNLERLRTERLAREAAKPKDA